MKKKMKIRSRGREKRTRSRGTLSLWDNAMTIDPLELSRKIQQALAPKSLPRTQGIDMASLFLPCKAAGGDLYDVVQLSEDLIGFYIFDISCQGVSSALISALAKVSFSSNIRVLNSPQQILDRINIELIEDVAANFFITAFVAFLDLHSNKLTYCNAGHTYPLVYRKSENKIIPLKTPGIFLGVYRNANFENESIFLFPNDILLMMTDGIYGLFDNEYEMEGREKFETMIQKNNYTSPADLVAKLKRRHSRMLIKGKQRDDITAIVVEIMTQSRRDQLKKDLGFSQDMPVYLQFLSYYEEIDTVSATVLRDMDEAGYSDEIIRKMKLTTTELLANAIGHGNKDNHSKKVTIGHVVDTSVVTLAIMDEGEGFDPRSVPDPTLPENLIKDHGRGLYIVRNYIDEIEFNSKGNRVLIRKFRFIKKYNEAR